MIRICLLLVLFVSFVSLAKADSFVITDGAFTVSGLATNATLGGNFSGAGYSANFGAHTFDARFPVSLCGFYIPCLAGDSVNLGGSSGHLDWTEISGAFTINGQSYNFNVPPIGAASFGFTSNFVSIPTGGDPMVTLTAPFTMSGDTVGGTGTPPVVGSAFISGSGTAYAVLILDSRFPDGLHYSFDHLTYQFGPQVPEPGAFLLLSTGLGFAGALRWRFGRRAD